MSSSLVTVLGLRLPIIAAPMAGGPSTPALVEAVGRVGGLGFLAGGYKSPEALDDEIATVASMSVPFGVNLFVPNPVPVDADAFRSYAATVASEAYRYGISLDDAQRIEDDDRWSDKIELLMTRPVPVISFTFGLPRPEVLDALRRTGALLMQTVTSVDEARIAAAAGLNALAVQASAAGGHSGTFTPRRPVPEVPITDLVAAIHDAVDLPLIAAGGVATGPDVAAAIGAGADAVAVGTVLLRTTEAGTSTTHRAALADPTRTGTVVTHAFTGRPARALRNEFTDRYTDVAPYGYPALHHLTSGMRKAAAAAGDPERVHLWAGTGYRHATADPIATIIERLTDQLS